MKEKKEKVKTKGKKREIAGRIIAAIMAILMLLAACSTFIYYLVLAYK